MINRSLVTTFSTFLVIICVQQISAQDNLVMKAVLELPGIDHQTFDHKTIVQACSQLLEQRAGKNPKAIAAVLMKRSEVLLAQDCAAARRDLDEICKLEPNEPLGYILRAEFFAYMKEPGLAWADSEKATTLARPLTAQPRLQALAVLSAAKRFWENGKTRDAIKYVDFAIELDPKQPHAHYMRARIYEFVDSKKCLESLNKLLELEPEALVLHAAREYILLMRGYTLSALNRPREALPSFLAIRALRPDKMSGELATSLAVAYLQLEKFNLAAFYASEAVRLDPKSGLDLGYLAMLSAKTGDTKAALKAIETALAVAPGDPFVNTAIADTYFELGRHADALEFYNKALRLGSDDPRVQMRAASFLATCPNAKYRDAERAVTLAQQSVAAKSWRAYQLWEPLMSLAEALAEQKNYVDAVTNAKKAVEVAGVEFGGRQGYLMRLEAFEKGMPWRAPVPIDGAEAGKRGRK